jgi:ubiquinone/menaquinone biosynthesis C-methylase UbiE
MHRIHMAHRHRPHSFQGRSSRVYDVLARRLHRPIYRKLARDVADLAPRQARVLDVGTGPGVLLIELAGRRPDLTLAGVDLSADMVAVAQHNLSAAGVPGTVQIGDARQLPFPDGSFDLIVSSFSLHHWDDPDSAIPELARVLRPGGRLCIYDLRLAPFQMLVDEADRRSLFTGAPVQRVAMKSRLPLLPRAIRQIMTVPGPAAVPD